MRKMQANGAIMEDGTKVVQAPSKSKVVGASLNREGGAKVVATIQISHSKEDGVKEAMEADGTSPNREGGAREVVVIIGASRSKVSKEGGAKQATEAGGISLSRVVIIADGVTSQPTKANKEVVGEITREVVGDRIASIKFLYLSP